MHTIKGYYEDGKITLKEHAPFTGKAEVIVTFLVQGPAGKPTPGREPETIRGTDIFSSFKDQLSNIIA